MSEPDDIPPLETGDCLTKAEFWRRYQAAPHIKKAELINGIVYVWWVDPPNGSMAMSSPVNNRRHGQPHFQFSSWLGIYSAFTPEVGGGDNSTLDLPSATNMTQPDLFLRLREAYGGQCREKADGYLEGAPELVAEVSASRTSIDLGPRFEVYLADGVREYVVWRVDDASVDWFVRRGRRFVHLRPTADGIRRSRVFPGLWLDAAALIRGDLATVFRVVQEGIASPEHAAFVARLRQIAGDAAT